MRLEGKTIVLTGAAGGIGSLLCRELKAEGASIIGVDRVDCPEADESILADLATEAGLVELCAKLAQLRIDILVNLAGMGSCHTALVEAKGRVPGLRATSFGDGTECPPQTGFGDLRIVA